MYYVMQNLFNNYNNREQQLLYDPDMPSDSHREMVAQVLAHEQAHQWFGNLVTMEWSVGSGCFFFQTRSVIGYIL